MDISKVFKANVKAIRLGAAPTSDEKQEVLNEELLTSKKRDKKFSTSSSPTFSVAKEASVIVNSITKLKQFLNENKHIYLQTNYLISRENESISDEERTRFEQQAEDVIQKCVEAIRSLKERAKANQSPRAGRQFKEHQENLFYLLDKYLKEVCKLYGEQKAIQVNRKMQKQTNSQLCSYVLKSIENTTAANGGDILRGDSTTTLSSASSTSMHSNNNRAMTNSVHELDLEEEEKRKKHLSSDEQQKKFESELSQQELLELEKENEQLFETLNSQLEEIRQVESKAIEVSKLAQMLTENIVSQAVTTENIEKSVIDSNSNLRLGNEEIKEAMKKSAALRLWVLFIIIVLSFTLLFLDWYND